MLRSLRDLEQYAVTASDGDVGHVANFLFDDERWTVRYLVVETEGYLDGREVLISPIAFREVTWSEHRFHLALTVDRIKHSPRVDSHKPVSRQHEHAYHRYYQYPAYWGYTGAWGVGAYPGLLAANALSAESADHHDESVDDVHLRSVREVHGYHVQGSDDGVGHVHDFIVDDETWAVRYLVIDTSNWWHGKKVLMSPAWVDAINWPERKVHIAMTRKELKASPEWSDAAAVNRAFEQRLYDYYGRPVYWGSDGRVTVEQPARSMHASHLGQEF